MKAIFIHTKVLQWSVTKGSCNCFPDNFFFFFCNLVLLLVNSGQAFSMDTSMEFLCHQEESQKTCWFSPEAPQKVAGWCYPKIVWRDRWEIRVKATVALCPQQPQPLRQQHALLLPLAFPLPPASSCTPALTGSNVLLTSQKTPEWVPGPGQEREWEHPAGRRGEDSSKQLCLTASEELLPGGFSLQSDSY